MLYQREGSHERGFSNGCECDEFFAAVLANLPVSFAFCLHSELLKQHLRFFVSIFVQCCSTLFSLMSFWAE